MATNYLAIVDVLEKSNSVNAETIHRELRKVLEAGGGLDVAKLAGFSSDGAAVMIGERTGVAKRLKKR